MEKIKQEIQEQIDNNKILLYMKGNPDMPRCGFSAQVVKILDSYEKEYNYIDILENPEIRANLPLVSNWPTFPQLFIRHELVGGCDIITEMHENKELEELLNNIN